jgi:hypothetical protein
MTLFAILMVLFAILIAVSVFASSQQTSSTTAQVIINNARTYLNESSASFWTDTEMLVWVNDGMEDIVTRTHALETTESVSLVADTIEYTITSTYITVKAVHYVDANSKVWGLKKGSPEHLGTDAFSEMQLEVPAFWYDWGGKVGVYPSLSSVTTETVTVYLVTRPTAIIISANVTTPAIYDKALTLYVVAQAWAKDRQTARYAHFMGMYMQELDRIRGDLNEFKKAAE